MHAGKRLSLAISPGAEKLDVKETDRVSYNLTKVGLFTMADFPSTRCITAVARAAYGSRSTIFEFTTQSAVRSTSPSPWR
jgi:hypothetical protein